MTPLATCDACRHPIYASDNVQGACACAAGEYIALAVRHAAQRDARVQRAIAVTAATPPPQAPSPSNAYAGLPLPVAKPKVAAGAPAAPPATLDDNTLLALMLAQGSNSSAVQAAQQPAPPKPPARPVRQAQAPIAPKPQRQSQSLPDLDPLWLLSSSARAEVEAAQGVGHAPMRWQQAAEPRNVMRGRPGYDPDGGGSNHGGAIPYFDFEALADEIPSAHTASSGSSDFDIDFGDLDAEIASYTDGVAAPLERRPYRVDHGTPEPIPFTANTENEDGHVVSQRGQRGFVAATVPRNIHAVRQAAQQVAAPPRQTDRQQAINAWAQRNPPAQAPAPQQYAPAQAPAPRQGTTQRQAPAGGMNAYQLALRNAF